MADLDIRIESDFTDHHKTDKMINRLGEASFRCFVRLLGWAARNRPKGILHGMNPEDIGIVAKWPDGQAFVDALVEVGFLDKRGRGLYKIHDWEEHQPWVFYAPERKEKAKKAAKAKHTKGRNGLRSAQLELEHSSNEKVAVPESAGSCAPFLSFPTPFSISGIAPSNAQEEELIPAGDPHEGPRGL